MKSTIFIQFKSRDAMNLLPKLSKHLTFFLLLSLYYLPVYAQNFILNVNEVTVECDSAELGDTGIINGVIYTKRSVDQITTVNASTTCTSGITDLSEMFRDTSAFNGDLSAWDVSSVTNMSYMFDGAESFNGDISAWDVSLSLIHISEPTRPY